MSFDGSNAQMVFESVAHEGFVEERGSKEALVIFGIGMSEMCFFNDQLQTKLVWLMFIIRNLKPMELIYSRFSTSMFGLHFTPWCHCLVSRKNEEPQPAAEFCNQRRIERDIAVEISGT
jgi:hypothetical protein